MDTMESIELNVHYTGAKKEDCSNFLLRVRGPCCKPVRCMHVGIQCYMQQQGCRDGPRPHSMRRCHTH